MLAGGGRLGQELTGWHQMYDCNRKVGPIKSWPDSDGDNLNGGEEVDRVGFEAGCDPAGVLELVEEAFNEIALPVKDLAVAPRHASASGRWDAGPDTRRRLRSQSAS
jgi:hypothetical protein